MRVDTQESPRKEGRKAKKEGGRGRAEGRRKEGWREEERKLLSPALVIVTRRCVSSWLVGGGGGDPDSWWSSSLSLTKHVPSEEECWQHHFPLRGRGISCSCDGRMWGVFDKECITDSVKKLYAPQEESLQSVMEKMGRCLRHWRDAVWDVPEPLVLSLVPKALHHKGCT